MIIRKINIKSFGQLVNMTLDFSEKTNVIEGQNEAGKSTVAAFIKYMLYGFDECESDECLSERRRRISWTTGVAEGSMNVIVKGKEYLITRSTVPNEIGGRVSYKEDSSIIDLESGTPAFGKRPAGEVFFGVDRRLFETTAFIGQLGETAISRNTVEESIENILFSASERDNTVRATNRIAEKMETLLHPGNTGGAIIDLLRKQDELENEFQQTDEANKLILIKEAELHEIRRRREEAEQKRDKLLDLDLSYRNSMIIETFDRLHELEEEAIARSERYNDYIRANTRADFVPSGEYLTDLAIARRAVNESYAHLESSKESYAKEKSAIGITKEIESAIELSDTLGGEKKINEALSSGASNKIKCLAGGILAMLVFIASIVFEIVGTELHIIPRIAVGALAAVALAGAGVLAYLFYGIVKSEVALCNTFGTQSLDDLKEKIKVIAEARLKRDTMIDSTENARLALEDAKLGYERARGELTRTILRWGEEPPLSDLEGYLDSLEARVRAFLDEKRRLREEKNAIEITVKEIRRSLADKSEIDIRAQVPPIRRKVLAEVDHEEILEGIASAREIIEEQQRLSFDVENELAELKYRATDPGELYSKIQALETKINSLRARHKAYFVALRSLGVASENLRAEISPRIAEYASLLLALMTDGKYTGIEIGEDMRICFRSEDGKLRDIDYLSGGTRDLAYIAVRMALIDMLYSEAPPVCFDETFSSQDNKRAASMMSSIKRLTDDGYQSFIFTCRAREATLASESIPGAGIFRLSVTGE